MGANVCKIYQQRTKVGPSKERVKSVIYEVHNRCLSFCKEIVIT